MKTLVKSIVGLVVVLVLTTSCDVAGIGDIEKEHTEYASGSGGGDDQPCQDRCD